MGLLIIRALLSCSGLVLMLSLFQCSPMESTLNQAPQDYDFVDRKSLRGGLTTSSDCLKQRYPDQPAAPREVKPLVPELAKMCISNNNITALKLHPLYEKVQFLVQQKDVDDDNDYDVIQSQYQNILNFVREQKLDKVVIYGLRDSTHTHSWIHNGWFRAWLDIMIQVNSLPCGGGEPLTLCWIDKKNKVPSSVWENALVFSSYGKGIYSYSDLEPIVQVNSSVQVLHLHHFDSWHPLVPTAHHWFRKDSQVLDTPTQGAIFLDWATDLVPSEIEANRPVVVDKRSSPPLLNNANDEKNVVFCGTMWDKNAEELQLVSRIAAENFQFPFHHYGRVQRLTNKTDLGSTYTNYPGFIGTRDQYQVLHDSFLAPAIQGETHLERGYAPCRIFKTISAGKLGISNNKAVRKLFPKNTVLVRHGNSREVIHHLLQDAVDLTTDENALAIRINKAMTTVQLQHTYLSRFNDVIDFIRKR